MWRNGALFIGVWLSMAHRRMSAVNGGVANGQWLWLINGGGWRRQCILSD